MSMEGNPILFILLLILLWRGVSAVLRRRSFEPKVVDRSFESKVDDLLEEMRQRPQVPTIAIESDPRLEYVRLYDLGVWASQSYGPVKLEGRSLQGLYCQPPAISPDRRYLALGRSIENPPNAWDNAFTVILIDRVTNEVHESRKVFHFVYFTSIDGDRVNFSESQGDKAPEYQRSLIYSDDDFVNIGTVDDLLERAESVK